MGEKNKTQQKLKKKKVINRLAGRYLGQETTNQNIGLHSYTSNVVGCRGNGLLFHSCPEVDGYKLITFIMDHNHRQKTDSTRVGQGKGEKILSTNTATGGEQTMMEIKVQ